MNLIDRVIASLSPELPVLIAGPTASGKSALAMAIAARFGRPVINADALQVYSDWLVLTARPSMKDEADVPHRLYGHVPGTQSYSVGDWLRDITPLLAETPPVIVGGTGLYFSALSDGLATIPPTPDNVRAEGDDRLAQYGVDTLIAELDGDTRARIDTSNPRRVQRAWEVMQSTGRGLASWQDKTGPPPLPIEQTQALVLSAPKDWLIPRIERRFDAMLELGVLDEARANAPTWHQGLPSAKAIGAAELVAHVNGDMKLDAAKQAIIVHSRQYAKRQRTWFRGRMKTWRWIDANAP